MPIYLYFHSSSIRSSSSTPTPTPHPLHRRTRSVYPPITSSRPQTVFRSLRKTRACASKLLERVWTRQRSYVQRSPEPSCPCEPLGLTHDMSLLVRYRYDQRRPSGRYRLGDFQQEQQARTRWPKPLSRTTPRSESPKSWPAPMLATCPCFMYAPRELAPYSTHRR